ncbi:MAG TPA: hypothetical protein VFK54_04625 [Candidatus Limnocylindrales bacterium]|nr:hypothetical protein [Candidatus Limnocylindrales bacterium]
MTNEVHRDRYRDAVANEVAALEQDIRHHVVDLEEAFSLRDWAGVARIYRAVAALADRLEALDPESWTRRVGRAELASDALLSRGPAELDGIDLEDEAVDVEPAIGRFAFGDTPPAWLSREDGAR